MSYDPYGFLKPWQEYRSVRSTKSTVSSSLYALHRPALTPVKRSGCVTSLEKLDLSQVSNLNAELLGLRAQEKEQLVDLNDRFATYIEKVHRLEKQNKVLLVELEALRQKQQDPSRLHLLYRQELRSLRGLLEAEAGEKMRMQARRDQLRNSCSQLKERYKEEARLRLQAEETLEKVREEAGQATLANSDVEGSIGSLLGEISFLHKVFGQESAELSAQVQAASLPVDVSLAGAKPDLAAALQEIRAQYETLAGRNMQAAEDWYRTRFASVAELASKNNEAVRSMREETAEYRRLLQSRSAEVEALRSVIDSLNKQLESVEDRQSSEVATYQERVANLEQEIREAKQEMARYLREYQDLLNVKMALDIEIAAYRKLLEGEEIRLSYSSPL
ncbi:neurofilament light polypeptide-like [Chelonoidis abingdonii]|uniref:neurofilament light polypeptide-like n=1 Tax=Chelonoidis abingdonii TaxID=106734 RepID=UPI0013F18184|nr:neurofilament light polypeptide-like [Chelonoidis abingdonii]